MISEHDLELARAYASAPINEFYEPVIRFEVGRKIHPAAHAVHRPVYFKALDDAAFFAVNSQVEDVFVLTVSFNVHMFRPVATGMLPPEIGYR